MNVLIETEGLVEGLCKVLFVVLDGMAGVGMVQEELLDNDKDWDKGALLKVKKTFFEKKTCWNLHVSNNVCMVYRRE